VVFSGFQSRSGQAAAQLFLELAAKNQGLDRHPTKKSTIYFQLFLRTREEFVELRIFISSCLGTCPKKPRKKLIMKRDTTALHSWLQSASKRTLEFIGWPSWLN